VSLLLLVLAAAAAGFAVILLAGRGQRTSPAAAAAGLEPPGGELGWVSAAGPAALERLLRLLLAELGYEVERADQVAGGAVDLVAVDRRPIRGGRIYVQAAWGELSVDGDAVRALVDAARGEAAGKALLVTLGRFSPEAREAASDTPVELVDGEQLAALVKRHLPQAWATRAV